MKEEPSKPPRDRSHDEAMAELYRDDPALALELINHILVDGDHGELLAVLRQRIASPDVRWWTEPVLASGRLA